MTRLDRIITRKAALAHEIGQLREALATGAQGVCQTVVPLCLGIQCAGAVASRQWLRAAALGGLTMALVRRLRAQR